MNPLQTTQFPFDEDKFFAPYTPRGKTDYPITVSTSYPIGSEQTRTLGDKNETATRAMRRSPPVSSTRDPQNQTAVQGETCPN